MKHLTQNVSLPPFLSSKSQGSKLNGKKWIESLPQSNDTRIFSESTVSQIQCYRLVYVLVIYCWIANYPNTYWLKQPFYCLMIFWARKWQPTPVLLPGESHGGRSLVGYSPWGRKESDTTERLHFSWVSLMLYMASRWLYSNIWHLGQGKQGSAGHLSSLCGSSGLQEQVF